jgi:hypothetical protein
MDLNTHENSTIVFDSSYRSIDDNRFTVNDWSQFYPGAAKAIPPNIPRPLGLPVVVTFYCDADHAGFWVTRRSNSGIIVYVNNAPITWYSTRQNTVESLTFGSEFVAMCIAVEKIESLR